MFFILKLKTIMELIDTPNPNAKKVEIDKQIDHLLNDIEKINGVYSIFLGPGFITIIKENNIEWESISQEIADIFDKL